MPAFPWTTLPNLRTPRLKLRAMHASDSADLFAIYGDPAVMAYASDPPFASPALIPQLLASVAQLFAAGTALEWGIVSLEEQRLIGTCGLHSFTADGQTAEVGCLLARRCWGQGLMAEALVPVIDLAFTALDVQTLLADIDAPNTRSLRLFQRLGFQPDLATAPLLRLQHAAWPAPAS